MTHPQVTLPNRKVVIEKLMGEPIPFSPDAYKTAPAKSPTSPVSSDVVTPRKPIIHFYVCDYGNTRVKEVADTFVKMLLQNGAMVWTERYSTHQPGFSVKAAALQTSADFFFQIHSKTAGQSHVRMYLNGIPRRFPLSDAISRMTFLWKLRTGALTEMECHCLSYKSIEIALKEFAQLDDFSIEAIQKTVRDKPADAAQEILIARNRLDQARSMIETYKNVSGPWKMEEGSLLARIVAIPIYRGLTQPFKTLLLDVIGQMQAKLDRMTQMLPEGDDESSGEDEDDGITIQVRDTNRPIPNSSWGTMLESFGDTSDGLDDEPENQIGQNSLERMQFLVGISGL